MTHERAFPIQQLPAAAGMIPWLLNLATRLLARGLNMPEPLVRTTGELVFAHVAAVETRVGKTFCPVRLLRRIQSRCAAGPLIPSPSIDAQGELP